MKRPADVVKIGFPVERNLSSSVCVRLRLQGRIDFEPGHWSAPVCLSGICLLLHCSVINYFEIDCRGLKKMGF